MSENTKNLFTIDNELLTKKIKKSSIANKKNIEKNIINIIKNSLIETNPEQYNFSGDVKFTTNSSSFMSNSSCNIFYFNC